MVDLDEKTILKRAYDLFLSFDDVITHGYRESVTLSQIEQFIDMDSTDEKMYKKMQLIKEADAKEQAKKKQREIAKSKIDPSMKDPSKSMSSDSYLNQAVPSVTAQNQGSIGSIGSATQKPSWMQEDTGPA